MNACDNSNRPSKSQRKRDMIERQKLGECLVLASSVRLACVPMSDDLREAILLCRTIKAHGGRRRQMQYIGKKMRELNDMEIAGIQNIVDSWQGSSKAQAAACRAIEHHRDRLLADDSALTDWLIQHPDIDAQILRTLIRNARRELVEQKTPKAYRALFQFFRAYT